MENQTQNRVVIGTVLTVLLFILYISQISPGILILLLMVPTLYDYVYMLKNGTGSYFYIVVPLNLYISYGTMALARLYSESKDTAFLMVITVALSDALQYFCGRHFGKTLVGGPSSNKTWEGYLGVLAAAVIMWPFAPHQETLLWTISGAVGDVLVSWLKRMIGVKDSSDLLGAHGGWLDRVDGILFAAIISYIFLD